MKDLKSFMKINETRLSCSLQNELELGKLNSLKNKNMSLSEWNKLLSFSENRSSIENFLAYRISGIYGLYSDGIDDADITPNALEYLKNKLLSIKEVKEVDVGVLKPRVFKVTLDNEETIYLESDTANSLKWDVGNFFRIIIPKIKKVSKNKWPEETYIKDYGLFTEIELINQFGYKSRSKIYDYYDAYKLFYFFQLIPQLPDLLVDEEDIKCFEELEKRASITHTLQNMMLVPYNYNSLRGYGLKTYFSNIPIKDRLDYTFLDLQEMKSDILFDDLAMQKRLKNKYCTRSSLDFLLKNASTLIPPCPQTTATNKEDIHSIYERCKSINATFF